MNTMKCLALVPALMLIAAAGCIKRSETITIFADGRLRLTAEIVGDPDDVYNGDAMPTAESGWQIEDRIETDSEGKKELTRTATREIRAGAEIPDSHGGGDSGAAFGLFERVVRLGVVGGIDQCRGRASSAEVVDTVVNRDPPQPGGSPAEFRRRHA